MNGGKRDIREEICRAKAMQKKKLKKFWCAVGINAAVTLTCCAAVAVYFVFANPLGITASESNISLTESTNQTSFEEDAQREPWFQVRVNERPYFESSTAEGSLFLENPETNRYNMQATVTLETNGEVVYNSELLRPGGQALLVRLSVELPPGEYPAVVTATALDRTTGEAVGSVEQSITLQVGESV